MAEETITVELDGPMMETTTADPLVVLSFASAYLKALVVVANERTRQPLNLHGLEILDKCIGAVSWARSEALPLAVDALDRAMNDPFERNDSIRAVGRAVRGLPEHVRPSVIINDSKRSITAVEPNEEQLVEVSDFLARVFRVGGKPPSVDLIDQVDESHIRLRGPESLIRELSQHLYSLVNVVAEVVIDPNTNKKTGTLMQFEEVSDVDPVMAWRTWFARNAPEWNDVDDIEAGLDR